MKAMVLCAGYGTRLGELTRDTPKPLLKAHGISLLDHILENLKLHGCSEVMINLHHHADQIRQSLEPWKERGLALNFSFEENLLGTAGAVKKVNDFFKGEEAFLVHYGDVITNVDLTQMLNLHKARRATATLLVHNRKRSNSSLTFDETFRVKAFVERPPESYWDTVDATWVNSGVMAFSSSVLDLIPESGHSDWPRDIFPKLIPSGQLYAYCLDRYRIAVDSPERLQQLEQDIAVGRMKIWRT